MHFAIGGIQFNSFIYGYADLSFVSSSDSPKMLSVRRCIASPSSTRVGCMLRTRSSPISKLGPLSMVSHQSVGMFALPFSGYFINVSSFVQCWRKRRDSTRTSVPLLQSKLSTALLRRTTEKLF